MNVSFINWRLQSPLYNKMGKQEKTESKSETLNQVYRQFSRQKYNKYKHQYPKMRESEIVSKIIKEWDNLGKEGKDKLYKIYFNNKFIAKIEPSEPDSAKRSVEKFSSDKKSLDKTAEKPVSVKIEFKEEGSHVSYGDRQIHSEHGSSKKSLESGNNQMSSAKTKKISPIRNDYITFYKYYYDKYHKEHESWTTKQLSKVISLLWQKRKKQFKKVCTKKENNPKVKKVINGRKLFRRVRKELSAPAVKAEWSRLPKESKLLWSQPNKTYQESASKNVGKMTFRCGTSQGESKGLGFMNKLIS